MGNHLLEIENLQVQYNTDEAVVHAVNGLTLTLDKGEALGVVGETGAGKSIILGSIGLALGGKYSAEMLRKGAAYGLVELVFTVEHPSQEAQLRALDIYPEEGQLILSRKLMDGRSVSKINGETVTTRILKDVATILIDIHGQHEHQTLIHRKNHLAFLDLFAREEIGDLKDKVKEAWNSCKENEKELALAIKDEDSRRREEDFLSFELEEITKAELKPGEDDLLEEQYKRMLTGRRMAEHMEEAYAYTSDNGGGNAADCISRAVRIFQEISGCDPLAESLYEQLSEIENLLNDFNHELSAARNSVEFSPEEFQEVEIRLNEINRLKSKYGNSVEEIEKYAGQVEEKLEKLHDYENYIASLQKKYEESCRKLEVLAEELSEIRQKQAQIFVERIRLGLKDLNFLDVQFEMKFTRLLECREDGIDEPEFLVSMNPGEPLRPLGMVASGGELSRIMLVIKTVLAYREEIATLIFDEIDTGISGITAGKVAEKMGMLAKEYQVICITHLAQIAAMADAHYVIEKTVQDGVTKTAINELTEEESVAELSRLLGGSAVTESIRQSAVELKKMAELSKRKSE